MPITYQYIPEDRLVRTVATGALTAHDFGEYCATVLADPVIEAGFIESLVIDTEAHILLTFRDLNPFPDIWKLYLKKGVLGTLILACSPAGYGIFRMFEGAIGSELMDPNISFSLVESAEEMEARIREIRLRERSVAAAVD